MRARDEFFSRFVGMLFLSIQHNIIKGIFREMGEGTGNAYKRLSKKEKRIKNLTAPFSDPHYYLGFSRVHLFRVPNRLNFYKITMALTYNHFFNNAISTVKFFEKLYLIYIYF